MNILQVISGRGVNGALVYCKILSERMAERGHNVTIVCKPNSWIEANVDRSKIKVVESTMTRIPFNEFRKIGSLIRKERIDLIHSHMTRAQNFAIGLKLMTGLPVVATAHNSHFEVHWNFNDFVIANSKSTYNYHSRINRVPAHRMETIYCCPDFSRFGKVDGKGISRVRKRLRLKDHEFLIGVIGEIAVRKGHISLIRALPKIIQSIPNVKIVFVGRFGRKQPYVRQLRKLILENGLQGRIKWVGRQSNVTDYMTASELTVVPSMEEPLGLVAIESLMTGTPVVASDTGGLAEIVANDQTGKLVPVGNSERLAEAIIQLAKDKELRQRLGQAGHKSVSQRFSADRLIEQVEQVYRRLLVTKKSA